MAHSHVEDFCHLIRLSCGESNSNLDIAISSNLPEHGRDFYAPLSLDVMQENPEAERNFLCVFDEKLLGDPLIELNLLKVKELGDYLVLHH